VLQRIQRLAESQLVLGLGRHRHAARAVGHQDHGVVGRQLPVDGDAVKGALDAHPEQQLGGLGRQLGVGLDEAQHRRVARRDHARALALRGQAHAAGGQPQLQRGALLADVGGHDRAREVRVAVGALRGLGTCVLVGSARAGSGIRFKFGVELGL